jgi:hypothetical protein
MMMTLAGILAPGLAHAAGTAPQQVLSTSRTTGTGNTATLNVTSQSKPGTSKAAKLNGLSTLSYKVSATYRDKTNYFAGAKTIRIPIGFDIQTINQDDGYEAVATKWARTPNKLLKMKLGANQTYTAKLTDKESQVAGAGTNKMVAVRYGFGIPSTNKWDTNLGTNYLELVPSASDF